MISIKTNEICTCISTLMLAIIINQTLNKFARPFFFNEYITCMDILYLFTECKNVVIN